jgi:hypothetical protein
MTLYSKNSTWDKVIFEENPAFWYSRSPKSQLLSGLSMVFTICKLPKFDHVSHGVTEIFVLVLNFSREKNFWSDDRSLFVQ